jgi:redox-sensitive bicupin YhaK (pirin superfamily)
MVTLRKADERGHFDFGWLNTYHSFSFSEYYDPKFMGFRSLRVINEDRVWPGEGFPTHPHRDMEIITYVLNGALEHKDSMGNGSVIRPGDMQRMSAGTGVTHSEYNHSKEDLVHFLQIWIIPDKRGLTPSYEQKLFTAEDKSGKFRLVASPDGRDGSVTIHQDVNLYATVLAAGEEVSYQLQPGRYGWLQVARGKVSLNGQPLKNGDGAALSEPQTVTITATEEAEVLLFDLN